MRGRRIQISGSADEDINISNLTYTHSLIKKLSQDILENEGGLVVTLGSDPKHKLNHNISIIFDWTILEAVQDCIRNGSINWPESQGAPVVTVGFSDAFKRIPPEKFELFDDLRSAGCIDIVLLESEIGVGGVLREKQEVFGDILVTLGGGPGVNHSSLLYRESKKPVIPLDIKIKKENRNASKKLSQDALEKPSRYFEYNPAERAVTAYSLLSCKNQPSLDRFSTNFFDFVSHLDKPRAFYVRLLNSSHCDFGDVQDYFRNVVDPVILDSGYERYEAGTTDSYEAFMNVEIFDNLHHSSLVIVDVTGLRPNCFIELGYALGRGKKTIILAREKTKLPWDISSIQCHFWSLTKTNDERKGNLMEFMEKNINKGPLVKKLQIF